MPDLTNLVHKTYEAQHNRYLVILEFEHRCLGGQPKSEELLKKWVSGKLEKEAARAEKRDLPYPSPEQRAEIIEAQNDRMIASRPDDIFAFFAVNCSPVRCAETARTRTPIRKAAKGQRSKEVLDKPNRTGKIDDVPAPFTPIQLLRHTYTDRIRACDIPCLLRLFDKPNSPQSKRQAYLAHTCPVSLTNRVLPLSIRHSLLTPAEVTVLPRLVPETVQSPARPGRQAAFFPPT